MRHGPANFYEPRSPEWRQAICDMKQTHSASQVAALMGISGNAVVGIWYRAGLPKTPREQVRARQRAAALRQHGNLQLTEE